MFSIINLVAIVVKEAAMKTVDKRLVVQIKNSKAIKEIKIEIIPVEIRAQGNITFEFENYRIICQEIIDLPPPCYQQHSLKMPIRMSRILVEFRD